MSVLHCPRDASKSVRIAGDSVLVLRLRKVDQDRFYTSVSHSTVGNDGGDHSSRMVEVYRHILGILENRDQIHHHHLAYNSWSFILS